ncbi:hypothetical protein Tco_1324851 [Tanacetum coccineum]
MNNKNDSYLKLELGRYAKKLLGDEVSSMVDGAFCVMFFGIHGMTHKGFKNFATTMVEHWDLLDIPNKEQQPNAL